jgi:outer membrane protein OmpA-like peptidoglycan-associated protein/osmotically-inducible protein OsmY
MKCNPLRWLWGLLPILGLTWLAVQMNYATIEADLTRRVDAQLRSSGMTWARSAFIGRDGKISGRAADEEEPVRAVEVARNTWGVRVVENRADLIERAETYQWSAARTANRIQLRGMVPNDATRQSIVASVRRTFPKAEISDSIGDNLVVRRGVPMLETWNAGVAFALRQLAGLKTGEVRLEALGLSVAGEAETAQSYRAVKTAMQNDLPRGIRLIDDRVTPPVIKPYVWSARHLGGDLTLTGYVPSERVRGEVTTAARSAFPRARLADRMELGDGAPSGFVTATAASLKDLARLEEGTSEVRDSQLALAGTAADEATAGDIRRSLRAATPQSFRVSDQIRFREPIAVQPPAAPPPVAVTPSPYTSAALVEAGRVVLSGYAPSPEGRMAAEQAARTRFPGRVIENRLEVAAGAPEAWQRCFDGGLFGIARAGTGRVALADRRLEVSGIADDEDMVDAIPGDVRGQLQGACDSNVRITAAPEPDGTWRAVSTSNQVTLSGDVTSQTVRSALMQQASRAFPGARIVDNMQVAESRSRRWPRTAELGLRLLSELKSGEAVLSRQQLAISGEAREAQTAASIRSRLERDVPRGYTGRERVSYALPAPPPLPLPKDAARLPQDPRAAACQDGLRSVARDGIIQFERAKADLARESSATLSRLAQVARDCPKVKIEIEGHTDAEGTPERNQRLSDRRAQAVVDYLVRAGVDPGKLVAIGYGETRPVAPNDSAENRARNRRIEFTVRE